MMSKPIVITISHQLGQAEAIRRIKGGAAQIFKMLPDKVVLLENRWNDNVLHFGVRALAQTVHGTIEVLDDSVKLEAKLPLLLSVFAERVKGYVAKRGGLLLERY